MGSVAQTDLDQEVALKINLAQNLAYLYLAQIANYIFPLLTVPYLARVLGPEGFGKLLLAQAAAQYLSWVVEYGYSFSATREAARLRHDPAGLGRVLASVIHARFLLLPLVAFLTYSLANLAPPLRGDWLLMVGIFLVALGGGFSFVWLFQAIERVKTIALLETGARFLHVLAVFLLVREPGQVALPLYLQAFALFLANGVGFYWALKSVRWPGLSGGFLWLRRGFGLFLYQLISGLYAGLPTFLGGFFLSPTQLGHYAAGDRLVRVLVNLWAPLARFFFPRLSFEAARGGEGRRRWLFYGGSLSLGMGLMASVSLFALAPFLASSLFGEGYEGVGGILRILALFLFLTALSSFLGLQVLLPLRLDRGLFYGTLLGILWNALTAWYAASRFGPQGLAWTVVLGEVWVVGVMLWWSFRKGAWKGWAGLT